MSLVIRPAHKTEREAIWAVLEPVIRTGETYALPQEMSCKEAIDYWFDPAHAVFIAEEDKAIIGTYYMRPNQRGGGAHVANCGYIVAQSASGRGVARAMCTHSLKQAKSRGFRAMQFNFVISSNERAVRLWQNLGFEIVGRLPGAYKHPLLGFVDALIMYQNLL